MPSPARCRLSRAAWIGPAILLLVWALTGNGYGFHRDELQFLDDARHLAAGFVAYPPMTSLLGRISIALFGISPMALRLPSVLLNAATLVLGSLLARTLGGGRAAQFLTAALMLPVALAFSSLLQYNTPDMLAWTLLGFAVAQVLATDDGRWWLLAGAAVGIGVESKYAIAFPVAGLLAGLLVLPSQRRHLRSRWFWLGALVALIVAAPNLVWLARHDLVTIHMEQHIHARDVRLGRADGFFTDQLKFTLFGLPFAIVGLVALARSVRFRLLAALYVGPLVLLAVARGRGYYLLPAYIPLYAAGAVACTRWLRPARWLQPARWQAAHSDVLRRLIVATATICVTADIVAASFLYLPIFRPQTAIWRWQMARSEDLRNEVGWPEFVAQVTAVRDSLTPAERASYAMLADNFGEAGALALYGPSHALPTPISPANSFWYRGYSSVSGTSPAETVIIVGSSLEDEHSFRDCRVAAQVTLPYGVHNEETDDHPEILVCHHLMLPWPDAWAHNQRFG